MQCAEAVEHLPELLNRTLAPERAAQLQAHLGTCSACRREWDETRLGAAVFDSHLPTEAIVALAWERAPTSVESGLAREHLESCPECADDLAAARESRMREMQVAPPQATRRASWALAGPLAAGLAVAAFVGGVYWGENRQPPPVVATASSSGQSGTPTSIETLRESEAKLRARLERLTSPQLNLPLLELLPDSARSRAAAPPEPEIAIGSGDAFVALVLSAPALTQAVAVELRDQPGHVVWSGGGLRPSVQGWYSVGIPAEFLTDGRFSVVLMPEGGGSPLATFAFRARRAPAASGKPLSRTSP